MGENNAPPENVSDFNKSELDNIAYNLNKPSPKDSKSAYDIPSTNQ